MKLFQLFAAKAPPPAPLAEQVPVPEAVPVMATPVEPPAPGATTVSPYAPGAWRIAITKGGVHPPEMWAQVTAEHLCPINPEMAGQRLLAARKLQSAIADALIPHHCDVQTTERAQLAVSMERLLASYHSEEAKADLQGRAEQAYAAIAAVAAGTEWESVFASPEAAAWAVDHLKVHFRTIQNIERQWHAKRNASHQLARQFAALPAAGN